MHRHLPNRARLAALLLALGAVIALPVGVAAHAEFERSNPEDGETVQGSPNVIRAVFSEALGDGSEMSLLDEGGETIATGGIDPANASRLRIDPPDLDPGDYEVQWKAFADDGHLETGTFTFTVSAPVTPPPSLAPEPSEEVSVPPSASAAPTVSAPPTPSPTAEPSPPANAAGANDVLLPIIAAVVIVGALGGYLLMRRRPAGP
jgi:methionine-rich copper-binding protein CopC